VLADVENPPHFDGTRIVAVPAGRLAAGAGTGFVNLVMAGALAAVLGHPPVEQVGEAAVEALGGKADGDAVRKAVAEGFRWAS
jgi:Pyruvate/2-oxoacid:ferredoxin oxidoreductase gamma subunit